MDNETTKPENTIEPENALSSNALSAIDAPPECISKVVDEIQAMRKAYVARAICNANRKKNTMSKRRAAEKNAKKMRKAQHKRRK